LSPPNKDVELTVRAAVPALLRVNACVLDVPPVTLPKPFLGGETEIAASVSKVAVTVQSASIWPLV
jgi:hypothetical protein